MTKRNFLYIIFTVALLMPVSADWKERVLLETDKALYLTGETVFFSVSTTDIMNRPVEFSKVAYVELLSEERSETQVMIDVHQSVGDGQLVIPDYLPTGYYRLVAYTQYMRNEGPATFHRKLIAIVNPMTFDKTDLRKKDAKALPFQSNPANNITIRPDRKVYPKRTQGVIEINNLPATARLVSVVISDAHNLPIFEDKINDTELLLTKSGESFTAEYEGHIIRAKIHSDSLQDVDIYLSAPGKGPLIYRGQTDKSGTVSFYTENGTLNNEIATVINTSSTKKHTVDIQSPFAGVPLAALPRLEIDSALVDRILQRSVALQLQKAFHSDTNNNEPITLASTLTPNRTYRLDDYTRFPTLEEVIIEFVSNVRFRRINEMRRISVSSPEQGAFTLGNSLVLLDNVPIFDHELLLQYNPLLMEKIDVYMGKYVFGAAFFDGIVSFSTYQGNLGGFKLDESTAIMNYPVVQSSRPFSAPSYSTDQQGLKHVPDLRHVLLWKPNTPTLGRDKITIPFSTSDLTGTYRVRATSLTVDGQLIQSTTTIEVK